MDKLELMIDFALEKRDFEWVRELVKRKEEAKKNNNNIICIDKSIRLSKAKALEDLNDIYVVKEEHGIRNIISTSSEDILKSNVVELKNCTYSNGLYAKQGAEIEYKQYDEGTTYLIKYYILGYAGGVQIGYAIDYMDKLEKINYMKKFNLK